MHRKLTAEKIEAVCRELLRAQRRVTVRQVRAALRARYQAVGRTERLAQILRRTEGRQDVLLAASHETEALLAELEKTRKRAELAEDRERSHQDYFARRAEEQRQEVAQRYASELQKVRRAEAERHLAIFQRASVLAQRLSKYETVEPLLAVDRAGR